MQNRNAFIEALQPGEGQAAARKQFFLERMTDQNNPGYLGALEWMQGAVCNHGAIYDQPKREGMYTQIDIFYGQVKMYADSQGSPSIALPIQEDVLMWKMIALWLLKVEDENGYEMSESVRAVEALLPQEVYQAFCDQAHEEDKQRLPINTLAYYIFQMGEAMMSLVTNPVKQA